MEKAIPELGTVVLSKAGRDAGRGFVVVGILPGEFVLIADGDLRKIGKPKKKKIKHLDVKPVCIPIIKQRCAGGETLYDSEIRRNLEALGYNLKDRVVDDKKEG